MSAASDADSDVTSAPRWGTTVTRPSAASWRMTSRTVARDTPRFSVSSRSMRRSPGRSRRSRIAERTRSAFEDEGFGGGSVGNAPKGTTVFYAQVWTRDPQNPAVKLVLSRLGPKAHAFPRDPRGPGVTVMVGPQFEKLVAGKSSVKVTDPVQVCVPPTG